MKHMGPKVSEVPSVWSIQRFLDAQPCEKLRRRNSKLQTKFLKAPDVFPPSPFFSSLPLIHTLQYHLNTECALSRAKKTVANKFP